MSRARIASSTINSLVTHSVTPSGGEYLAIGSSGIIRPNTGGAVGLAVGPLETGVTVLNEGSISLRGGKTNTAGNGGAGGIAVDIQGQALLVNQGTIAGGNGGFSAHGMYTGGAGGAGVYLSAGTLVNGGMIDGGRGGTGFNDGNGGVGVLLDGATLTNTGTIAGGGTKGTGVAGAGVFLVGGTLVTSGAIDGGMGATTQADAVQFGTATASLVVQDGASFGGLVAADASAADTLVLDTATAGTLAGLGTAFTGFTDVDVTAGNSWRLTQAAASLSGGLNLAAGAIVSVSGSLSFAGTSTVDGSVVLQNSQTLSLGAVSGTGSLTLGHDATLTVLGAASSGASFVFASANGGELDIGGGSAFLASVADFGGKDVIDLLNTPKTGFEYLQGPDSGSLFIENGGTLSAVLVFDGTYTKDDFKLADDGHGGVTIKFG